MYGSYNMSTIGAYFQTWSTTWVSDPAKMDLAQIKDASIVYLAFAKPDMTYTRNSFSGTGLSFSQDFGVVKGAIDILKKRGILVMLSVGGGADWSSPKKCNYDSWVNLMNDLGCAGIDIDWEVGCSDEKALTEAIKTIRSKSGCKISFAGWSTGAFGKNGDNFQGMNIHAMINAGSMVDWINVMCYDAGTSFDSRGAISAYRIYYKGPLVLGFEVGNQAWGGARLQIDEVKRNCEWIKNENLKNGVFLWSWQKGNDGISVSGREVIDTAKSIFGGVVVPPVTKTEFACPSCKTKLTVSLT
jgi:chitinase